MTLVIGCGVGAAAASLLIHVVVGPPFGPYIIGAVVASVPWMLYTSMLEIAGISAKRTGILGEEWTTKELSRLRRSGWLFINHVMIGGRDIDHVAIGPGGVVAIDSKFRTHWKSKECEDFARTARNARWDLAPKVDLRWQEITSLVAVWGPAALDLNASMVRENDLTIVRGDELPTHLAALPKVMSDSEVKRAYHCLDDYVATRDRLEIEEAGPIPASVELNFLDAMATVAAFVATVLAVTPLTSLPPAGLWSATAGLVIATVGWTVRWRFGRRPWVRHVCTAVITTAAGLSVIMGGTLIIDRITR